jgi:hypothetical protein
MTREEVNEHLLRAFKDFYMEKLSKIEEMSEFKKNYMIEVTRLLINDSYLSSQMKGEMPLKVKQFIEKYINNVKNSG